MNNLNTRHSAVQQKYAWFVRQLNDEIQQATKSLAWIDYRESIINLVDQATELALELAPLEVEVREQERQRLAQIRARVEAERAQAEQRQEAAQAVRRVLDREENAAVHRRES